MTKMRMSKYSKPYLGMLFFAISLLFVQAYADLSLPSYLGNIVNIGIQQGGIENAVPLAINSTEMDRVVLFMNNVNRTYVFGNYTLINNFSADYNSYLQKYPVLQNISIYVLKDVNQSVIDQLNPVMAKSILTTYFLEELYENQSIAINLDTNFTILLHSAKTEQQFFDILEILPTAILTTIMSIIDQKFNSFGESMLIQAAISPISNIYKALGMDTNKIQMDYMFNIGGIMVLLTLLSMSCTIIVGYYGSKAATGIAKDIRRDVFQKIEAFSSTEFDCFSTASLITRSTNDVTQVQNVLLMIIRFVFYAPILGIGGIIMAFNVAPSMWWIIALSVAMMFSAVFIIFYIAIPKFRSTQRLLDRLNLVARESLTGIMVVRAFNRQKFEEDRFEKANTDLSLVNLYINRVMAFLTPAIMLILNTTTIAIIWFGSHEVSYGTIQIGSMIAFIQYAVQIMIAFIMMTITFTILPRASVSIARISEVLKREIIIEDPQNSKHFPEPFNGIVEFRNVFFHYPEAENDVLQDISFIAQPGQTTALIGSTGSGKSTIVNLIPRFYEVTSGSILVDGIDIKEISQHELRDKIGFVPQKSSLFSGTIESNLLFANENATFKELRSAIEIAQAAEFVDSKSEGMKTPIAQGGMNVSGGQKQRLSIARALVKKPPIYILDDSFSALDFKTDANLRKAFKEKTANSTLLMVTQRVATIKHAEQIIVLEQGKIVGKGTHAELMELCPTYKEIALSQLSLEELA